MTDFEVKEIFDVGKLELISEEKRPSLCSFSSYSSSICSESTIDLGDLDHNKTRIDHSEGHDEREPKPLQNNFLNANIIKYPNGRTDESEPIEPSIKPVKQSYRTFNKSLSMHDVSNLTTLNLTVKSNTVSSETINSQSLSSTTKSKDSGFQRSLSCLSLTSGKRSYDHVQSKVKAYIQNIKESEALNKKNKLLKKLDQLSEPVVLVKESEDVSLLEKDDLLREIQELKHELQEKSLYIDAQQRNYNKLLLKFAEARNTIDKLRVQSMSFNYSDEDDSKNQILSNSLVNLDSNDYKLSKNFVQFSSCIVEEEVVDTANNFIKEKFQPILHSSPFEKSLSPVRKIFSSSSRLDKNYRPLTSLSLGSQPQKTLKEEALAKSFDVVSRNSSISFNHPKILQRECMSIDLPNDDPFDKVKKWQASLPSINLLGSHSSSDCEDPRLNSPPHGNIKKSEGCCPSKVFSNSEGNENEICNVLSQELQNKCVISEMEVDAERQEPPLKNIRVIDKTMRKEKQLNTCVLSKHIGIGAKVCFDGSERIPVTNQRQKNIKNQCENSHQTNNLTKGSRGKLMNSTSRESLVSDGGSTHLPKSSSISCCRINKFYPDDDNSDDTSSISSSVLESETSIPEESHKRIKRRLEFSEVKVASKVPKNTKSKSSQTTFTLREPKLNFTSDFENGGPLLNNQIAKNKCTNNESCLKNKSSNHLTKSHMKTESSQRKAWNARNNAKFHVCKDFSFSKCGSLMECLRDMEGLVSKGSFVISSVINRNNTSKAAC